jgi:hypothetical protein
MGLILGLAGSIGAVCAPFIAGQLADRHFSTERFLAVLLAVGGVVKWITASQTGYGAWLLLSIAYSVVYMPTLALSNSMAFANLDNRERQFPKVRVWGTIGWIAASWIFPMIYLQSGLQLQLMPPFLVGPELPNVTARLADSLRFSALISWGYALFCLTLPHTPPRRDATEKLAFRKAFGLLREPSFAVLIAAALPISIIHQVYFLQTPPFISQMGQLDSQIGLAGPIWLSSRPSDDHRAIQRNHRDGAAGHDARTPGLSDRDHHRGPGLFHPVHDLEPDFAPGGSPGRQPGAARDLLRLLLRLRLHLH